MNPDICNRLQFIVIDYNDENFNPKASKMVRKLFQIIVIDYNSFVINYNYEKHNNRTDSEQTQLEGMGITHLFLILKHKCK